MPPRIRSLQRLRAAALLLTGMAMAGVLALTASAPASAAAATPGPASSIAASDIRGWNWADARDNYVCGNVVPSGLWDSDSYAAVHSKATAVADQLAARGANTVRLPMNVTTVGGSWWNSYQAAIDAITARGMKVVLAEWDQECLGTYARDGRMDQGWEGMWDAIVARYNSNSSVHFEIFNEPFGYSTPEWLDQAATWINRYPQIDRSRILVPGSGMSYNTTDAGRDTRFSGTKLAFHTYAEWQPARTYDQWRSQIREVVGEFANRAVMTEFGTYLATGYDFKNAASTENNVQYIRALTDEFAAQRIGSIHWVGVRDNDQWRMFTLSGATQNGNGSTIGLAVTNQSALDRIHIGWRMSQTAASKSIVSAASGECLDVPGHSVTPSTPVTIYDCSGASNQRWRLGVDGTIVGVESGLCLDVAGYSVAPGTTVQTYTCNGGANQRWRVTTGGAIVAEQSGLCLDVWNAGTANGNAVKVYTCSGARHQSWSLT
ncbi:carbohydrate-binding protein [Rathayibacter caricis DSM 15933]|uniref:Carbohydrate-binding protein n=2 Tax=Rathayibacter caricis TaxID=110936 RepID=A0A2T4UNW5_9MICO|nr:carbohydrate-binding protein [Rathayibacter caricis DSM 15933]